MTAAHLSLSHHHTKGGYINAMLILLLLLLLLAIYGGVAISPLLWIVVVAIALAYVISGPRRGAWY